MTLLRLPWAPGERNADWPMRWEAVASGVLPLIGRVARACRGRWIVVAVIAVCCLCAKRAGAQCAVTPYIVVDAQTCDWTSAERPLILPDNTSDPSGALNLLQTQLTDSYSTGSTGNGLLFGLMTFASGTNFGANAQVGLFLNIAGGPTPDPACNANAALSFTCTANPCTVATNWTATFFTTLSGNACENAQTGATLRTTGANQQAAFAISGTTLEFGVTFASPIERTACWCCQTVLWRAQLRRFQRPVSC